MRGVCVVIIVVPESVVVVIVVAAAAAAAARCLMDPGVMLSRRARFGCVQLTEMMRADGTRVCLAGSRIKLIK